MEPIAGVEIPPPRFHGRDRAGAAARAAARGPRGRGALRHGVHRGTGHTRTDHLRIMGLAEAAVEFACDTSKPGGAFLCKVFQGGTERELLRPIEARLPYRQARQAAGQPLGIGRALRRRHRLQGRWRANSAVSRGTHSFFSIETQEGLACADCGANVPAG